MNKTPNYLNKKINTSSVVQQVIDAITMSMINKELKPGDKIPTEVELSHSLGVGRLSIREAIKVLVYNGVLEIRRPEGTFVCDGANNNLINPMLYGIILNQGGSYEYIAELRLLMEVGVIKLAIEKCTDEEKNELKRKYENLKNSIDSGDGTLIFEADNDFHQFISEMGKNPLVDKINALVRIITHEIRFKTTMQMINNGDSKEFLEAHENICSAICNSNAERIDDIVKQGYFQSRISL